MLDAISKGYKVEIRPGSVALVNLKTDAMREFGSIAEAYASLGGPVC